MKMFKVFSMGLVMLMAVGCGGAPPAEVERTESGLTFFQTPVDGSPGGLRAEVSDIYSCAGWNYRMLFGLEQYPHPGSPTGWYAHVGQPSIAGIGTSGVGGPAADVSADVYLNCPGGILPAASGTLEDGRPFSNRLFADLSAAPIECTLTTVWPASWHAANPVVSVFLGAYDYAPSSPSSHDGGILSLSLFTAPWNPRLDMVGGYGWCDDGWKSITLYSVNKLPMQPPLPPMPPPKPAGWLPLCSTVDTMCSSSRLVSLICGHPDCAIDPPCEGLNVADTITCFNTPPPCCQ